MFGHDGLLGSQAPVGVGYAAATGRPAVVVLGDGACEEDYVLGAIGHAATVQAPVLFVVEDNEWSVNTYKDKRRLWGILEVAETFGLTVEECTGRPESVMEAANCLTMTDDKIDLSRLPALIEVPVTRCCAHNSTRDQSHQPCRTYEAWRDRIEGGRQIEAEEQKRVMSLVEETTARCGGRLAV
jgi:acetoin:2,6-dichlorophenolindophenol oxidoreductase subunit alpha